MLISIDTLFLPYGLGISFKVQQEETYSEKFSRLKEDPLGERLVVNGLTGTNIL